MALGKKSFPVPSVTELYETDYYHWLTENASLLRVGRLEETDAQNIAEELEDMGRSERRALASHIEILLLHLLKWQFQPSHRSSSWRGSIYNARKSVLRLLSDSPSLRPRVFEEIAMEYRHARFNAVNETGLPEAAFPRECPYSVEEILDEGFWPE